MADESSKKDGSPVEMTPGDDGTKVPLTGNAPPTVEEAKYVANPNGDAKIDVGSVPTFSGLNKEELMKYSNDPFWVRLRWFLFIMFWVAWVAMLVMAVIIIIQAPGCAPPPVRLWAEEGAIYQVDTSSLPKDTDLIAQLDSLGVNSVYLPGLISEKDFSMSNYGADSLIEGLVKENKGIITDLPSSIAPQNVLFLNATTAGVVDSLGNFVYSNPNLTSILVEFALSTWMQRGVKGFLINTPDPRNGEMFQNELNSLITPDGGAVSSNIIDMKDQTENIKNTVAFKDFLEEHAGNWSYYKFQPNYEAPKFSNYQVRLMNIAMFMFEGTPILQNFKSEDMPTLSTTLIYELSKFRSHDGVKFGVVNMLNTTSPDLLGFTRVQKGTPAYAIALNFGDAPATMDFSSTPNIAGEGNVQLDSETTSINDVDDMKRKLTLAAVPLKAFEGLVIQFVADFS